MIRKHYNPEYGLILSRVICSRGSKELVQELLAAGADIDEHDVDSEGRKLTPLLAALRISDLHLAWWLLEQGARVGGEALAGACLINAASTDEQHAKMAFVGELVQRGINVNAAVCFDNQYAYDGGTWTPLFLCGLVGDLATADLLLREQGDPNMPSFFRDLLCPDCVGANPRIGPRSETEWVWTVSTPLDAAVACQRLDMTQLLLKHGAISGRPGNTGYERVTMESRGAIREMIYQHLGANRTLFEQSDINSKNHQAEIDRLRERSRNGAIGSLGNDAQICEHKWLPGAMTFRLTYML